MAWRWPSFVCQCCTSLSWGCSIGCLPSILSSSSVKRADLASTAGSNSDPGQSRLKRPFALHLKQRPSRRNRSYSSWGKITRVELASRWRKFPHRVGSSHLRRIRRTSSHSVRCLVPGEEPTFSLPEDNHRRSPPSDVCYDSTKNCPNFGVPVSSWSRSPRYALPLHTSSRI